MRIAWLANTFSAKGGAELTDETMINEGEKNHQIIKVSSRDKIPEADLYILSNVSKFSTDQLYDAYGNDHNFITYFHDYEIALRPEHPQIIGNAKLNIFLSPLHRDTMMKYVNCTIPRSLCIPSPVKSELFHDLKNKKRAGYLYVGHCLPHKGTVALEQWLKEDDKRILNHFGNGTINHERAINDKPMPNIFMNDIYNKFSTFVFFPMWDEPFGRTVAEAYLCGCKMEVNTTKIGFFSYDWNYSDKKAVAKHMDEAPAKFWAAISHYKLYDLAKKIKGIFK